ncbi:MAG: Ppx/GppA phosphatase family protein [Clostridia bacterium]|jgi:exopolyphosphatase/guanosine-5'-triphosphate,3'-diphosphate pyrophosphatase|nr:Ppx/GppA family phosphatase [Clostridia bacterium]MDH7572715.1 Ppx/GppA phosphatase family protein [Clostridia bacterium]
MLVGSEIRASVDIGTNSVRLLVARVEKDALTPLCRQLASTRLGEGIQVSGRLESDAWRRTLEALGGFARIISAYLPDEVTAVATSAVREAANGSEFAAAAGRVLGAPVKVLTGEEEARLSYLGAVRGLGWERAVVVDIGGGSTELTYPAGDTLVSRSRPVGAVRCTQARSSRADITRELELLTAGVPQGLPLIAVGGTATTLAAVEMSLTPYDPDRVHGHRLSVRQIDRLYARLAALDLAQRRRVPGLQPERADIILAGIAILQEVLALLSREEVIVSEADLLYALLLEPEAAASASDRS